MGSGVHPSTLPAPAGLLNTVAPNLVVIRGLREIFKVQLYSMTRGISVGGCRRADLQRISTFEMFAKPLPGAARATPDPRLFAALRLVLCFRWLPRLTNPC